MIDPDSALLYIQIGIAVAAAICAAALIRKALNFHGNLRSGGVVLAVCIPIFSYLSIHLPMYFMSESEYIQLHLASDVFMFGSAGLVVIAIIGFTIDHMSERPNWLMASAAAVVCIGILPFLYRFSQDGLITKYRITIVEPKDPRTIGTSPVQPTEPANASPAEDASKNSTPN